MPTEPIFFGNDQKSGLERLGGASPAAINVVTDARGCVRRRPCIATYDEAPSTVVDSNGIYGLHAAETGDVFAVGGLNGASRSIYRVKDGVATNLSSGPSRELRGSRRPIMAETEALMVFSAGDITQKVVLATMASTRLGGDPPVSSHIVALASTLLANDLTVDRAKIRYSGVATSTAYTGHETWSFGGIGLSGYISSESRPDATIAIAENSNELFVWGASSVQVFAPGGQDTFTVASGQEYGLSAPYSVIKADHQFAWLDQRRRFVLSDGRNFTLIGGAGTVQATVDAMTTVDDCFGYRVHTGPVDCFVWTFPTSGVTMVYQVGSGWGQWQGFDTPNNWGQFTVRSHAHRRVDNANIVGTAAGYIGQLEMGGTTDLGTAVNATVTTGFYDRGTDAQKWCKRVRLAMERGTVDSSTPPVGLLSYADEPDAWCAPIPVSFGASGDTSVSVVLDSLGVYRRRAWKFVFPVEVDIALVRVTEEFTVLEQ